MTAAPLHAILLVYLFSALSAVAVERRLILNSFFKRAIFIYAVSACQVTLSIELLSTVHALTGWKLLFVNCGLTAATLAFTRGLKAERRVPWRVLIARIHADFSALRKDFTSLTIVIIGACLFFLVVTLAAAMAPFNDSYHFEMPRFWMQHQSILPFPVNNPRITTISFLSEAFTLPFFIAFRNDYGTILGTLSGGVLAIAVVYGLARRLIDNIFASASAAAFCVAFATFAGAIFSGAMEMLLSGAFFGASILFLIDAMSESPPARGKMTDIACSFFLFVMACGAKNPTLLLAPFYLLIVALALRKDASADVSGPLRRSLGRIAAAGGIAIICSGVGWNYLSNKIYFGEKGMPRLMKATISHDYAPRFVWTRMCRGAATLMFDTLWVPKSMRDGYKRINERTVELLGGKDSLPEDDNYYCFQPGPMKGLGPFGILLVTPALLIAAYRALRFVRQPPLSEGPSDMNLLIVSSSTIAAFLMVHLVFRWQSIGMVRLMSPLTVTAASLSALLLKRPLGRAIGLLLFIFVAAVYCVYWSGIVSRRIGGGSGPLFQAISKLQNERSMVLKCQWKDEPETEIVRREDFNYREVYAPILARIRQPSTIGLIGNENSEALYLFGYRAQNRIVPLVDASAEDRIIERNIDDIDYVVAADKFDQAELWAQKHKLDRIYICRGPRGPLAMVFVNRARIKEGSQSAGDRQ